MEEDPAVCVEIRAYTLSAPVVLVARQCLNLEAAASTGGFLGSTFLAGGTPGPNASEQNAPESNALVPPNESSPSNEVDSPYEVPSNKFR